ncbi:MAG: class I SAM-dependent methyltransferase [Candidatus Babeliales bacterium]
MKNSSDTWNSEHYKKYASFQNHEWALAALFDHVTFNGDETILDIGCGDGNLTAKIAQKVPSGSVIGIDLSTSMIKAAQQSFNAVANLSFEIADATSFSFKQKFDYVTSFFVLHWIEDQLTVLKNIKKALKPNGKTIIIMSAVQEDSPIILKAFERLEQEGLWVSTVKKANKRHFPQSTKDFEQLLHQAGFCHKQITVVERASSTLSLEAAVQTLMRWVPHSTELPYEQALKFAQALGGAMYKQLNKKPEESISFLQHFLLIVAW